MTVDLLRYSQPESSHRLVLLHGWGADAEDLLSIGKEICREVLPPLEILSFRAPHLHPQGEGRQWYGLFPANWSEVPSAINSLTTRLRELDDSKIPLKKTFLLGFSQGGAMAIACGSELPLAGLIGCSAYRHPDWIGSAYRPPVMLIHGRQDEIVPFAAAKELREYLRQSSKQEVELFAFEGGHYIPLEMINRIQLKILNWLG